MKQVEVYLVDAFTANGTGGNPAGVVLNAECLSEQEKQYIAKVVGYSETAFVSRDDEVDFQLSFFTPTEEVDFCGHATLSAFTVMCQRGVLSAGQYTQRTKAGLLGVMIDADGYVVMEQKLPIYLGRISYEEVSEFIGLESSVLASTQLPSEMVSTGLADILVAVPNGYLDKIKINEARLSEFCKKHQLIGAHVFELCGPNSEYTASCRNFAPLVGIPEESATGSSNGALACYLSKHLTNIDTSEFTFEQGRAMGCTSRVTASVTLCNEQVTQVKVGGLAHEFDVKKVNVA
ncbi:PhzF family phenazine biosynthesis protein [Pseudoalteromonas obscura]|uniref:PhzF family phenazine biosynthesis protein n=1 Tax=Pseudoalteromonas obscura TaxID=3048491 RepID=A0ABT7EIZ9_9GAMM|nr:PhzF family phenazine biosynthesis protein [Pseudoalteromonas sp. P94(2023)]MDK2595017.1 PhzF family phenazine biosynthesis protein [Pseudoalteromonas sp. P94(2023)]